MTADDPGQTGATPPPGATVEPAGLPGTVPASRPVAEPGPIPDPTPGSGGDPDAGPGAATAGAAAEVAWSRTFGAVDLGSTPYAVAVDGEVVYVGGSFTGVMAGMPEGTYTRVARWDGTGWEALGAGLDGTVRALAVSGDRLYVGGEFAVAGQTVVAARLACWDGTRWSAVGGGVGSAASPSLASVRALAVDGQTLYVAGLFDTVGQGDQAVSAPGLAAFDTAAGTWRGFGSGLTFLGGPGEGRALAVSGGTVYVGGYFDDAGGLATGSLAALDVATGTWRGFGGGIRSGEFVGSVESLAADPTAGTIYVGGSFTAVDTVVASGAVALDGDRFRSLGAFTYFGDPATASVQALAVAGGKVYAGGEFTTAGNAAASRFAVWDGAGWALPGEGVDNIVRALAAYGDGVVVTGDFGYSGALRITHGGIWTGAGWQTFGQGLSYDPYADATVFALARTPAGVVAGGYFDQAGPRSVGSVAMWTGAEWANLGGGIRAANGLGTVYATATLGDDLYVTGSFASAGGGVATNVARWDGTAWSALGSGLNHTGYALAVLGDRLVVGGSFTAAGASPAKGIALWDPAAGEWSAFGNAPAYDGKVLALEVVADRYLLVGGEFTTLRVDGVDRVRGLNGLAVVDTEAPPDPADPLPGYYLVPGVERAGGVGSVRALRVVGPKLYVGGTFDTAGVARWADPPRTGFAAGNLAAWRFGGDGSWFAPGNTDEPVMALASPDGRTLTVGGWFRAAGPVAAGGVARFDPTTSAWIPYGAGIGPGLRDTRRAEALLHAPDDQLWVGGTFNTAAGQPSCSIAVATGPPGV